MKSLVTLSLATTGALFLCNCDSMEDDRRPRSTTTTTEETTTSHPFSAIPDSTTVETQTTRTY